MLKLLEQQYNQMLFLEKNVSTKMKNFQLDKNTKKKGEKD